MTQSAHKQQDHDQDEEDHFCPAEGSGREEQSVES